MKFLLISGSLRKESFNTKLLRYVADKFLKGYEFEFSDISRFPLYVDDNQPVPEEVNRFKEQIRNSDIIIFSTPEHNWSISSALKNAIDWASRPPSSSAWEGKVGIIMSASPGMLGGARAQYHLRQILNSVNMILVQKPELFINFAQEKFDGDKLKDETADKLIGTAISNAIKLYEKFQKES